MKEYYRANKGFLAGIGKIEIERETESSVWINGRKHSKRSSWDNYFPTREEAKDFLFKDACEKVEKADKKLYEAIEYRIRIAAL